MKQMHAQGIQPFLCVDAWAHVGVHAHDQYDGCASDDHRNIKQPGLA